MSQKKVDAITGLLRAMKFDLKLLDPILNLGDDDDIPDSFKADDIAATYLETRKEIATGSVQKQIDDAVEAAVKDHEKATYAKIVESLKGRMKRRAQLEFDKPIKDIEIDAVFDAYESKMADESSHTDAALKAKFDAVVEKYNAAVDQVEALKNEKETVLQEKEAFEKDLRSEIAEDQALNAALDSIPWAFDGARLEREKRIARADFKSRARITADGSLIDKETGTALMRADETGKYHNVKEWVQEYADKYKLRKVSRSEDDIRTPAGEKFISGQKDEEEARRKVSEVSKEIIKMAEEMGISREEAAKML